MADETPALDYGVDHIDSRGTVALQVDGNDLVHINPPDDEGMAFMTVFSSSHPNAFVLWAGSVNVLERGVDGSQ